MAIKTKVSECLPHKDPIKRPDYTEAEIQALRAVHGGRGSADQQRMAIDFLMRGFGTHDISYRPGDPHETSFCEGKRWCGTLIVYMLKQAPTKTDPDKIAVRQSIEER